MPSYSMNGHMDFRRTGFEFFQNPRTRRHLVGIQRALTPNKTSFYYMLVIFDLPEQLHAMIDGSESSKYVACLPCKFIPTLKAFYSK